ncbi:hypothetical protein IT409_02325 [Candidatus Falkowbacteria bacterium]|nr:hypothetical protein [Candidatus Falkowbacteria bacterium]
MFDAFEYAVTQDVAPQSSITFDFNITAKNQPVEIPHQITLIRNDVVILQFTQTINVISPYYATVVKHNFPTAMKTTWRPTVELTLKNEGSENWVNPTLKSTDVDGTLSWFFDWSWVDKKTVQVKKATIKPGEEVTFKFRIKPYWKAGTYPHVYKLWTGKQMILINGQELLERQTRVDR